MYKLLRERNGLLYSSYASKIYRVGSWEYPKFGKLFVFDTLKNLKNHMPCPHRFVAYKCEVRDPEPIEIIARWRGDFESFWREKCWWCMDAPKGTLVCSAVKLTEKVYC